MVRLKGYVTRIKIKWKDDIFIFIKMQLIENLLIFKAKIPNSK